MSGGEYDILVDNRARRQKLNKEKHETLNQIIALENELNNLRNVAIINIPKAAPPLEAEVSKLEAKQARLERDICALDSSYEETLRIIFGVGYKMVRHQYINGAYHIYYQGLGESRGDGIGHGHAILYLDGHVEQIREAFASGIPLNSENKIRTKQMRRGKHRSASHKNPRFVYASSE